MRLDYIEYYKPSHEQRLLLNQCFQTTLSVDELDQVLVRVNHALNDFHSFKNCARRGKVRDRVKSAKSFIKNHRCSFGDSETTTDYIRFKNDQINLIKQEPTQLRGVEDKGPIFLLKRRLFEIFDSYHCDIVNHIQSYSRSVRLISKKKEMVFIVNKASFMSLVKDSSNSSFIGYLTNVEPVSWNSNKNPRLSYDHLMDTSVYLDSRSHTLGKLKPPQSIFLSSRKMDH